ncbi:MAG: nickel-binding protein [Hyphomonadaceae bacterium]
MPIYMDRHRLHGMSAADVAAAHAQDQEIQGKYNVEYLTYWYNVATGCGYCLVDAPDKETAIRVHAESHAQVPEDIIEVDIRAVRAYLGRIADPEAVLAKKEPIAETGTRIIMFTDIVGSTEMTGRLGDAGAMEIIRQHDVLVRDALDAHDGREVKHLGDGVMAAFDDPNAAVRCACAVIRGAGAIDGLSLRIGLHAGEPVEESNDLFGQAVQMAARICADASVDSIVVSPELRELVAQAEFPMTPLGRRMLKGFSEPVALFAVDWAAAAPG